MQKKRKGNGPRICKISSVVTEPDKFIQRIILVFVNHIRNSQGARGGVHTYKHADLSVYNIHDVTTWKIYSVRRTASVSHRAILQLYAHVHDVLW